MDGRTALTAVHRQPVRHTGQGQRLRRGQAFLQVRRRPVVLRRRQKQQIRQERRSQRPIPRPRQMNAAQTVPDPLRRPGLPVCGKGAALPQQLPEDISPFPRCMGWTERTLIGQLGAVLGLHQRIAGQVLPQDRLKFLMHLFSPRQPWYCASVIRHVYRIAPGVHSKSRASVKKSEIFFGWYPHAEQSGSLQLVLRTRLSSRMPIRDMPVQMRNPCCAARVPHPFPV